MLLAVRGEAQEMDTRIRAVGLAAVTDAPTYARYAALYFTWSAEAGRRPADPATVKAWLEEMGQTHAPASLVPMLAGVRKALRAAAQDMASAQAAAAFSEALRVIKAPKKNTNAVRRSFILSVAEERRVLAIMTPRDAGLFRFLMATGCRISEALGVRVDRCREDSEAWIVPVLGKGNKSRDVRVSAELMDTILGDCSGSEWLFETSAGKPVDRTYAYRRISEAVCKATGKRFSPHCARHTFATRTLERTGKVKAVSAYLGHSSAAITLDMYTHEELTDTDLGLY
ncbi:MAG: site-specific integrase [Rectinemataceae bacterium]